MPCTLCDGTGWVLLDSGLAPCPCCVGGKVPALEATLRQERAEFEGALRR